MLLQQEVRNLLKNQKGERSPFTTLLQERVLNTELFLIDIIYWIWLRYVPSYTHMTDHKRSFHLECYCNSLQHQSSKKSSYYKASEFSKYHLHLRCLKIQLSIKVNSTCTRSAICKSCPDVFHMGTYRHTTPGHTWWPGTMFTGHCSTRTVQGSLAAAVLQLWEVCSTAELTSLGKILTHCLSFRCELTWSALSPVALGNTNSKKNLKYLLSIT